MQEKRILVLSFYYPPDLSAGSFRAAALVEALQNGQSPRVWIDVITSMPNRYQSFSSVVPEREGDGRVRVERIEVPSHRSGMFDQAKAFARYARDAMRLAQSRHYELIFATSSRLMTAALGGWVARRSRTPLYLDIRDIFVDNMGEVLPKGAARVVTPLLSLLERWAIGCARRVNLVSPGFRDYFRRRYPRQSFSYHTNGVDDEFVLEHPRAGAAERSVGGPVRVVYAGNIGKGQGLDAIIPVVAQRLLGLATFKVIGDGGRRQHLVRALADAGVANVELAAPVPRGQLIKEYEAADVLFLHLNDYEAFRTVLPSKVFEYAALGKPVWAGVSGFAAQFLSEEVSNCAVFPPCNVEEAIRAFGRLDVRDAPREGFVRKFSRRAIMKAMAADVVGCMAQEVSG
jgi:glycosyltransferase involved in cell wall biosynthesis